MMNNLFNKDTLLYGMLMSLLIIVIVYILISLIMKKSKKSILTTLIIVYIIGIPITLWIPYNKMIKFDSFEKAFDFTYPNGKIIYKKEYKNMMFVYSATFYESNINHSYPGAFSLFLKENDKWVIKKDEGENIYNKHCLYNKKVGICYDVYLVPYPKENVTGIFIQSSDIEQPLTEKTKIKDSYRTEYEMFESLNYYIDFNDKNYKMNTYFGIVNKKIDNDFTIEIDSIKYRLKEYDNVCRIYR